MNLSVIHAECSDDLLIRSVSIKEKLNKTLMFVGKCRLQNSSVSKKEELPSTH